MRRSTVGSRLGCYLDPACPCESCCRHAEYLDEPLRNVVVQDAHSELVSCATIVVVVALEGQEVEARHYCPIVTHEQFRVRVELGEGHARRFKLPSTLREPY